MHCEILPHLRAGGAFQMGLDQALLEAAGADPLRPPCFRTYEWDEPTLSLGWFQEFALASAEDRFARVAIVRRPTGGGAILHDHDLTYALVLPESVAGRRALREIYRLAHQAIAGVLAAAGVPAAFRGPGFAHQAESRPLLCFRDGDESDLLLAGNKILGSAQRRSKGAVLLHGSLLLRRSTLVPELPGILDLTEPALSPNVFPQAFADAVARALEAEPRPGPLSSACRSRAEELALGQFSAESWTRRR